MKDRDLDLISLRPTISAETAGTSADEHFQNQTLRPIVKLQQDLLLEIFKNYVIKYRSRFEELSAEKKLIFIENSLQKDTKFRNSLKGVIIGQFSLQEYRIYNLHSSALNKRIINLIKNAIQDRLQLLEAAS